MVLSSLFVTLALSLSSLEGALDEVITPSVLISERGAVVSVSDKVAGGYFIKTPCGNNGFLTDGKHIYNIDVVIDPGHGGKDPGSVGRNIYEKELALLVSNEVKEELAEYGYSSILTREDDYYTSIATRSSIANVLNPKLFVSIHFNAAPNTLNSETPGTEVYYQYESSESKRLSGLLWEEVYNTLSEKDIAGWGANKDAGVKYKLLYNQKDFFGILRHTNADIPSALIEVGFLSNAREEEIYKNSSVREDIAIAISKGIDRFIKNQNDSGGGFVDPIDPIPRIAGGGGRVICEDIRLE